MTTSKDILGHISAGRILDVATGGGGFIRFLVEGLNDYTEIIGIDSNERAATAFASAFQDQTDIRFEMGDALQLSYADASFDIVSISNSLHHFDDPVQVLGQMKRVLRPGGRLILAEMYRDEQTETQKTHVFLHHWWAAVDRVNGVVHNDTFLRQELVQLITDLGFQDLVLYDLSDLTENPNNPEILAELEPVFDRYIQRAAGYPELQARGDELRRRVTQVGFHSATTLVVIGVKPEM